MHSTTVSGKVLGSRVLPSTSSHRRLSSGVFPVNLPTHMSPVAVVAADGQAPDAAIDIGPAISSKVQALPDSAGSLSKEEREKIISDSIRGIPDFPKPGILFWDVTTLMLNPQAFQLAIDAMVERYREQQVDVVAGRE